MQTHKWDEVVRGGMAEDGPRTLTTVERTCRLLDTLKELEGAGVSELADHLGMSKGGVYNHLATLHEHQFVVRTDEGYELGAKLFNVGQFVKHRSRLYNVAKSEVEKLAEETGECAHLMVEQFGRGIYYHKAIGGEGIAQEYHIELLEEPDHLHWSSSGKALLAELPEERVREIAAEHGLPRMTDHTITDVDELLGELAEVREQGYAQNDEEQIRGARAVGSAVTHRDEVLGSISVSGPTSRIDDEKFHETYPRLVTQLTNVIEVTLETRDGQARPEL